MSLKPKGWRAVLSTFGTPQRPRRGSNGEQLWVGPSALHGLDLRLPHQTSFLVVCSKGQPIHWLCEGRGAPRDIAFVCGPYPTDGRALPVLLALSRSSPAAVFVGDLDPYGVVQYVETRRMLQRANGPILLYGGVDDAWLEAIEHRLIRGRRLEQIQVPLSRPETTLLTKVERAIDLEELVGRRCLAVLRTGYKIELEGATNPALYGPSHRRWVFRYLRSRIANWRATALPPSSARSHG
jgi:hypothetical protein